MQIQLADTTYDLSGALPLTLGDLRRLKKEQGVTLENLASMDVDVVAKVMLHVFRKVDAAVTEDQIDSLPVTRLSDIARFIQSATIPDRPTSG